MHTIGRPPVAAVPWRAQTGRVVLIALLLAVAVGCTIAPAKTKPKVTACGTTKTAANVPIHVLVIAVHISCATAQTVERKYAQGIRASLGRGNGGGGPVKVKGWTCQGYAT